MKIIVSCNPIRTHQNYIVVTWGYCVTSVRSNFVRKYDLLLLYDWPVSNRHKYLILTKEIFFGAAHTWSHTCKPIQPQSERHASSTTQLCLCSLSKQWTERLCMTERHTKSHACTLTPPPHTHLPLNAPCLLISWFARLASAADGSVCTTAPLLLCRVDNCTLDLSVGKAFYFVSLKGIQWWFICKQPTTHTLWTLH